MSQIIPYLPLIVAVFLAFVQVGIAIYIVHGLAAQKTGQEQRVKDKRAAMISLFKAKGAAKGADAYNQFVSEFGTLEAAFADCPEVLKAFDTAYPQIDGQRADTLNRILVEALVDSKLCSREVAESRAWIRTYSINTPTP